MIRSRLRSKTLGSTPVPGPHPRPDARTRQEGVSQGTAHGMLSALEDYLRRCFESETSPRVGELAGQHGWKGERFEGTFHRSTGSPLSTYIKERQISVARLFLIHTDLSVDRVGYISGSGTRRTFFREFHARNGLTPARFAGGMECL